MASTPRDRPATGPGKVALYPLLQRMNSGDSHDVHSSKMSPSASSIGLTTSARSRQPFGGISPGLSGYSFFATPPPRSQNRNDAETTARAIRKSPEDFARTFARSFAASTTAMMCSGCGFFLSIPSPDATAFDFLQSRFQRRCPTLLFALADSDSSGSISKYEASRFLLKQGFDISNIEQILSQFQSEDLGSIHGEDFSKLCALAQTADTATISSAVRMVDPRRRLALQLYGSIVQPWGAPNPQQWNEQACNHLGVRGCVRLYQTGMLLSIAVFLQGQDLDIRAYVDALLSEEICSNSEGLQTSFRYVIEHAEPVLTLSVTSHSSNKEMMAAYCKDLERFVSSGSIPLEGAVASDSGQIDSISVEGGTEQVDASFLEVKLESQKNGDTSTNKPDDSVSAPAIASVATGIKLNLDTALAIQQKIVDTETGGMSSRKSPQSSANVMSTVSPLSSKQKSTEKSKRSAAVGMRNRQMYNWVSDSDSDSDPDSSIQKHGRRHDTTPSAWNNASGSSPKGTSTGHNNSASVAADQKLSSRSSPGDRSESKDFLRKSADAPPSGDSLAQPCNSSRRKGLEVEAKSFASVLFDYIAQEPDELTIRRGQGLKVLAMHADGWCLVQDQVGNCGVVPGNYLKYLSTDQLKSFDQQAGLEGRNDGLSSPQQAEKIELSQWISSTQILGHAFLEKLSTYRPGPAASHKSDQLGIQDKLAIARDDITSLLSAFVELAHHSQRPSPSSGHSPDVRDRTSKMSAVGSPAVADFGSTSSRKAAATEPREGATAASGGGNTARSNAATTGAATSSLAALRTSKKQGGQVAPDDSSDALLDTSTSSSSTDSFTFEPNPPRGGGGGGGGGVAGSAEPWAAGRNGRWAGRRGDNPAHDRSGDLSDGSDDDTSVSESSGLKQWRRPGTDSPRTGEVHGLRPAGGGGRGSGDADGGGVVGGAPWCVRVQLIEARDLPQRDGPLPELVCLVSLVQLGGQPLTAGSLAVDHAVGRGAGAGTGHGSKMVVEAQFRSKAAGRSASPVWSQSFTLTDAVPNGKVLESMPRLGVQRVAVSGQAMLLLLTVHPASAVGGVGVVGGEGFYARATEIIKPGLAEDHWVLLRSRAGVPLTGEGGRPSAVHLRVHYCRDPTVPVGGAINGFWS